MVSGSWFKKASPTASTSTSTTTGTSTSTSTNQDGADPQQDGRGPQLMTEGKPLDIVFLQDTTGSQGPYIEAARKAIRSICDKISAHGELSHGSLRFNLIAFRDHPPQDNTYVTKSYGFTSDITVMQKNLTSLIASGGGDGPEAQTAAMADALNLDWVEDAVKMVVLITDAPPHGIGEAGDGFPDGSPDQNDPLALARQMAERGITLFVIACEPSLSRYQNALDFYMALVKITSGRLFPLLMADKLGDYIVGSAVETIETEKIISEFENVIVDDVYEKAISMDVVTENLRQKLVERGAQINTLEVENPYVSNSIVAANAEFWGAAKDIKSAKKKVLKNEEPRMHADYARGGKAPMVSQQAQQYSFSQANRVVMQSMARGSHVTPTGYVSKVGGKAVLREQPPPAPPST